MSKHLQKTANEMYEMYKRKEFVWKSGDLVQDMDYNHLKNARLSQINYMKRHGLTNHAVKETIIKIFDEEIKLREDSAKTAETKQIVAEKTEKEPIKARKGVSFRSGKYYVYIGIKSDHIYLGRYNNLDDANAIRKKAEDIKADNDLDTAYEILCGMRAETKPRKSTKGMTKESTGKYATNIERIVDEKTNKDLFNQPAVVVKTNEWNIGDVYEFSNNMSYWKEGVLMLIDDGHYYAKIDGELVKYEAIRIPKQEIVYISIMEIAAERGLNPNNIAITR